MRKWKWKNTISFWFLPQVFLKHFSPSQFFGNFILVFKKKWVGGGRKLMRFHIKVYVILFNSFCVFLLENIDVLLVLSIKNNTIIQNKTGDRQSITSSSWARLTNPWKLFKSNKPTRQLSFWEFKILRWFTIIDAYEVGLYVVVLTDVESFSPGTVLLFYHYCTHQSNLTDRTL